LRILRVIAQLDAISMAAVPPPHFAFPQQDAIARRKLSVVVELRRNDSYRCNQDVMPSISCRRDGSTPEALWLHRAM